MSDLSDSKKKKWAELLSKMDKLYENSETMPFDVHENDVQNAQDVFNHKSHLLENSILLKQIELLFIDVDLIEEKMKARLEALKNYSENKEQENESFEQSLSSIAEKPLSPEKAKVTKIDDDRRKKLLSSLPSQPRKLAAAEAAAAATGSTSPPTLPASNKLIHNAESGTGESGKKEMNLNDGVTSTSSTITERLNNINSVKEQTPEISNTDEEPILGVTGRTAGKAEENESSYSRNKKGVSVYPNSYNPKVCYLTVGSTVAYKPKLTSNGGSMKRKIPDDMLDWFQCIILKIVNDEGSRFVIQDIEAAESGLTTSIFKCNSREIIHIPLAKEAAAKHQVLKNYPTGMKVLGKYPDTTTFYPAVVIGKRMIDSIWYSVLRFEGEEEVDKETLVERQYVLQHPKK